MWPRTKLGRVMLVIVLGLITMTIFLANSAQEGVLFLAGIFNAFLVLKLIHLLEAMED